jgi:hypothetical protein
MGRSWPSTLSSWEICQQGTWCSTQKRRWQQKLVHPSDYNASRASPRAKEKTPRSSGSDGYGVTVELLPRKVAGFHAVKPGGTTYVDRLVWRGSES